jgi:hypothetical protein
MKIYLTTSYAIGSEVDPLNPFSHSVLMVAVRGMYNYHYLKI